LKYFTWYFQLIILSLRKYFHEMTRAEALNIAQINKKDEFYTQYGDIERELEHYKDYFLGKTVYCNCDDPRTSNFALYFKKNFHYLGLNLLLCSCFKIQDNDMFSNTVKDPALYMEYDGKSDSGTIKNLLGDGDFRSKECQDLLDRADIVVTNPPFSLFREYISNIINKDKRFLIIGNVNAISYKECFQLIIDGKMWLGCTIHSGDREFRVPNDYPLNSAGHRIDINGNKYIRVKGVRWFTNMEYSERHRDIKLTKQYDPELYPKYDNIDAINVGKTSDIPIDYFGLIGVPITFIDKYNPDQFRIEGNEYSMNIAGGRCYLNGQRMYSRIFISHIKEEKLTPTIPFEFEESKITTAKFYYGNQ
jgi:hypothetical protein